MRNGRASGCLPPVQHLLLEVLEQCLVFRIPREVFELVRIVFEVVKILIPLRNCERIAIATQRWAHILSNDPKDIRALGGRDRRHQYQQGEHEG